MRAPSRTTAQRVYEGSGDGKKKKKKKSVKRGRFSAGVGTERLPMYISSFLILCERRTKKKVFFFLLSAPIFYSIIVSLVLRARDCLCVCT